MKIEIILTNIDAHYSCIPRPLSGYSGRIYGHANWDSDKNAYIITLPFEEYQKAARDIALCSHLPFGRWSIGVNVIPDEGSQDAKILELETALKSLSKQLETETEKNAKLSATILVDEPAPVAHAVLSLTQENSRLVELGAMHYRQLRAIGKTLELSNLESLTNKTDLIKAIIAKE